MQGDELGSVVEACKAGDRQAWAELHQELAPELYRFCRRVLQKSEDAEDATGEILLKIRMKLGSYDASRPLRPWVYRLASNHCVDILRRKHRQPVEIAVTPEELAEAPLSIDAPSPHDYVIRQEDRTLVRNAVAKLSDRARLVLVMRYYAELSYEDIAQALGVSPSFVGVVLLRARTRLRKLLKETES